MEALREPPQASTFIPLAEHRSATPASFYSGPPVLHYHSDRSKLIVLEREAAGNALLQPLLQQAKFANGASADHDTATNGTTESDGDAQRVVEDVDVWVTSDKLYLFSTATSAGLSISYPTISLHAIQTLPSPDPAAQTPSLPPSQGVYMQLITPATPANEQEDEEPDSLSLTIIPTASAPPQGPGSASAPTAADLGDEIETEDQPEQTPAQALFTALSACADLHPDPVEDEEMGDGDDEDGVGGSRLVRAGLAIPLMGGAGGDGGDGLPPPMPGSGGWITAENMHEFVDEDGNWIEGDDDEEDAGEQGEAGEDGKQPLGPGAGTVRGREQDDGEGPEGGAGDEETKWQKTG